MSLFLWLVLTVVYGAASTWYTIKKHQASKYRDKSDFTFNLMMCYTFSALVAVVTLVAWPMVVLLVGIAAVGVGLYKFACWLHDKYL